MTAIWRKLIWKEWREQVWKMIALTAISVSLQLYLLISDPLEEIKSIFFAVVGLVCGAFFIALGVAAHERTAGSLDFTRSLPLARWKWAVVRLTIGALAATAPLIVVVLLVISASWLMGRPIDTSNLAWQGALGAILCLSVYLWTVAAGVHRSSELKAGLAAVCLFVGWFALVALLESLCRFFVPSLWGIHRILVRFSPAGIGLLPDPARTAAPHQYVPWEVYLPQFLSLAGTTLWSVRHYGCLTAADNRSPTATNAAGLSPGALRPPRRSPLAAIAWKECREAWPICLAGLIIVAVLLLPGLIDMATPDNSTSGKRPRDFALATPLFALGTIMALVLGVGGHTGDLEPRVWQFWRSRPIAPAGWFWSKYFIGAAVLLIAFDGTLAAIDVMAGGPTLLLHDPFWWTGPLVHLFAYSAAVWMICQLRQPIYAGILALAIVIAVLITGEYPVGRPLLPWLSNHQVMVSRPKLGAPLSAVLDWLATSYLQFAAPMLALSAACALLAWFAVRRSTPWSRIASAVPG